MNARDLYQLASKCFEKKPLSLWTEIATHFFPERQQFTAESNANESFADGLMTIYPLLVRRDLGDSFDTMLRPTNQQWFHMGVKDDDFRGDNEAKRWLEDKAERMRRAMFDRVTQFHNAVKEGDHDFAAFGQCVIQVETVKDRPEIGPHLLFRCWHLKDVAWYLGTYGEIACVFRKWKPYCSTLATIFKDVHKDVTAEASKNPYSEVECIHMVVPASMYDGEYTGQRLGTPYVSIHYDIAHEKVMEAVGKWSREYVIPRWRTYGHEYAVSPATIIALPEARLLQAMSLTLLKAGEKAVDPPLWGFPDILRGDVNTYPGGFTAVDSSYDVRSGSPLNALQTAGKDAIPIGIDMLKDSRLMLAEAFYINKITPPLLTTDPSMTAFQAGQIVQEYIRQATPLFTPLETEYNGGICDEVFEQMYGSMIRLESKGIKTPLDIPRSLGGADIQFRFESPLHDAIEKQNVTKLLEGNAVVAQVLAHDASVVNLPDWKTALRDALNGIWKAKWINSERHVEAMEAAQAQAQQTQQILALAQQGADVAETAGRAAQSLATV